MWPTTKPFHYGLREGSKAKTGGRREGLLFSIPCLNPSLQRHPQRKREGVRDILKFMKNRKTYEYGKSIID
jgi:hypothetical protein